MRLDGRLADKMRDIKITRNFTKYAEGSILIEVGDTKVICTASVEEKVPPFLKESNQGWITAEYGMLPRSTQTRMIRDASRGKASGRAQEIQRLIGRCLRSVVDLTVLAGRTIWLDCDVIQADGGTRVASITGSYIALADALVYLKEKNLIERIPLNDFLAAISVGIVDNKILADLNYEEDSKAEVDINFVMTGRGEFVEIQGTAEGAPFSKQNFLALSSLAEKSIKQLIQIQNDILGNDIINKR